MHGHPLLAPEPALGTGIFGLAHRPEESLVHLLAVPFEATTSYGRGTAAGPQAICAASDQVDLLDPEFGRPHRAGVYLHAAPRRLRALARQARRDAAPIIARIGRIGRSPALRRRLAHVNAAGAAVNAWLEAETGRLLDAGRIVGILGGDHSVSFGAIRAHARRRPGLGILQLDAHADLREAYEGFTWSHASIMHNVTTRIPEVARLVQVGVRDFCDEEQAQIRGSRGRIVTFFDGDLQARRLSGEPFTEIVRKIAASLPRDVYLSFDIDGLDPTLCPGTGTPVPGGLGFPEVSLLLLEVVRSGRRIAGFDLTEVAPAAGDRQWNANVGARLLHKLIGATLLSRLVALSPGLPSAPRPGVL